MTASPSVAVVIPTYNRSRYLERAVKSALAQTRHADQVIVVDDGSTDDTQGVLARHARDRNLEIILLPHSGSPALARNAGLARVTTSYVAFLDSDDEWLPKKLDLQARLVSVNKAATLVCGNAVIVDPSGAPRGLYFAKERQGPPHWLDERTVAGANPVITSTALVRVDVLRVLGGFPTQRRILEDFHMWSRLLSEGFGIYSAEPVALYRSHSEGASHDRCDNAVRKLFAVRSLLRSAKTESRERWRAALTLQYAECAGWYGGMARIARARRLLVRARQLAGFAPMRWVGALRRSLWAFKAAWRERG